MLKNSFFTVQLKIKGARMRYYKIRGSYKPRGISRKNSSIAGRKKQKRIDEYWIFRRHSDAQWKLGSALEHFYVEQKRALSSGISIQNVY